MNWNYGKFEFDVPNIQENLGTEQKELKTYNYWHNTNELSKVVTITRLLTQKLKGGQKWLQSHDYWHINQKNRQKLCNTHDYWCIVRRMNQSSCKDTTIYVKLIVWTEFVINTRLLTQESKFWQKWLQTHEYWHKIRNFDRHY